MKTLKQIREELAVEHKIHPDIFSAIANPKNHDKLSGPMITAMGDAARRLGENPGFGEVASGSSRLALLPQMVTRPSPDAPLDRTKNITEPDKTNTIILDGKETEIPTVFKVAQPAPLDEAHKSLGNKDPLGTMQNKAENGTKDPKTGVEKNNKWRVTVKNSDGTYSTNENGIFVGLHDHDDKEHRWSEVGYARRIKSGREFTKLSRSDSHPDGIVFHHLIRALEREWHKSRGAYHDTGPANEARLDAVTTHPLFKTLLQHQIETGTPPMDYSQPGNWGVWKHPHTGKEHLVIVDHGYSEEVQQSYKAARLADHKGKEDEEWAKRAEARRREGKPTYTNYGESPSWFKGVAANIQQKTNP
jgi:hypothetical protein